MYNVLNAPRSIGTMNVRTIQDGVQHQPLAHVAIMAKCNYHHRTHRLRPYTYFSKRMTLSPANFEQIYGCITWPSLSLPLVLSKITASTNGLEVIHGYSVSKASCTTTLEPSNQMKVSHHHTCNFMFTIPMLPFNSACTGIPHSRRIRC